MCMCYMVQKQMETLTVASYYETYTHKNFTGIFTCMQNGRVVHYFEYADLRFDGVEINLQKQKD